MGKKRGVINFSTAQEFLRNVGGDAAITVVKLCERKGRGITDEELAKKMRVKVTEIRTVLNRLHYRGIAYYQKKKNKNTGWYTYTWEVSTRRIVELLLESQAEKIEKLEAKENFEKDYSFFSCKNNCEHFPFEVAAEYQFRCPDCGQVMKSVDNVKRMRDIKQQVDAVRKEVQELEKMG